MKFVKSRARYEASNVYFNPETKEAASYKWWIFVKEIKGVLYFNDHNYSISTQKHQRKVLRLLGELGLKFVTVNTRRSLSDFKTKQEILAAEKVQRQKDKDALERKRVERNERAKELRALKKKETEKLAVILPF